MASVRRKQFDRFMIGVLFVGDHDLVYQIVRLILEMLALRL